MSKVLKLYNTFTKTFEEVRLGTKLIETRRDHHDIIRGSFYICGPTVYSESHIGHALTYVRADLFRRFMKSVFNVRLATVMNITDIDDKILLKVAEELPKTEHLEKDPARHPFNQISEKYYKSFLDDMRCIRVEPPDLTIKVSRHIPSIIRYINLLEKRGHAYITPKGDIYFHTLSLKNYVGRTRTDVDLRVNPDEFKRDPRDFVLWKAAKLGEPVWDYYSVVSNQHIPGRPGWHVQCSSISSAMFGNNLDFHFGGIDLLFPHHYNEEACCCAYHGLDTSTNLHVWSKNWLHSGHLVLKDQKMSKSLGNVITIKDFINDSSINALRLMGISTHYRSNIELTGALTNNLKSLDHKLSAFASYLSDGLRKICDHGLNSNEMQDDEDRDFQSYLEATYQDILDGISDDFDLNRGLNSILDLARAVYNRGLDSIGSQNIVASWHLLNDWCKICGLEYGSMDNEHDETLIQLIRDFRYKVRGHTVLSLKNLKNTKDAISSGNMNGYIELMEALLRECDDLRSRLDKLGFVERDGKTQQ